MQDLCVVIPAYLEEENLKLILPRISNVLRSMNLEYEILVIDTCETMDQTNNVCAQFLDVRYINRTPGNLYGDAVRTGIREADAHYVLFMDADGSHTPEFIPVLFNRRIDHDVVIASRYTKGGGTDNSKVLILMSKIVNTIYSAVLNIKCKDVSNSFKLYKGNLLKKVELHCKNFDIVEEMLFKLCRINRNLRICEVPYVFKMRMFGQTKRNLITFVISFAFTLLKLRFGKLRNRNNES